MKHITRYSITNSFITTLIILLFAVLPGYSQQHIPVWQRQLQYRITIDSFVIKKIANLQYDVSDSFTRLDLYIPIHNREPKPLLLLIHGGPVSPNIPVKPKDWQAYQDYGWLCAQKGYVTAVINHRLFSDTATNLSYQDITKALHFLVKQSPAYNSDTSRIAIWLFSKAGAHLQRILGAPAIKKIVSFYGVYNNSDIGNIPDDKSILIVRCGGDNVKVLRNTDAVIPHLLQKNIRLEVINHRDGLHGFDLLQKGEQTGRIVESAFSFLKEN